MKKLIKKPASKTVEAYLPPSCKCEIRCFIQKGGGSAGKIAMNSAQSQMVKYNR